MTHSGHGGELAFQPLSENSANCTLQAALPGSSTHFWQQTSLCVPLGETVVLAIAQRSPWHQD